jgi:hypothetical protein
MNPEKKSPDLEQLKQLLAKSYNGSEADDVPPMPDGLRDRIADQYGQSATTPSPQVESQKVSFFSAVAQLFATPALRAATALVILLLVATVIIINVPSNPKGIRGGGEPTSSITCVLHGLDAAEEEAVAKSGLSKEALRFSKSATELQGAIEAEGAVLIINGETDQILAYLPGEDTPTIEEPLPTDPAELTAKIAQIIAKLSK